MKPDLRTSDMVTLHGVTIPTAEPNWWARQLYRQTMKQIRAKSPSNFGHLISMRHVFTPVFPTMATTGSVLLINPDFLERLETVPRAAFVMMHEGMHRSGKHHLRMKWRDPRLWNIATDHHINAQLHVLRNELNVEMPTVTETIGEGVGAITREVSFGILHDNPEWILRQSCEEIYLWLKQKDEDTEEKTKKWIEDNAPALKELADAIKKQMSGDAGEQGAPEGGSTPGDGGGEGEADGQPGGGGGDKPAQQMPTVLLPAGGTDMEQRIEERKIDAANARDMADAIERKREAKDKNVIAVKRGGGGVGTGGGGDTLIEALVDRLPPAVDYTDELDDLTNKAIPTDMSYGRVSKSALAQGRLSPGLVWSEAAREIVVIVDVSGSIDKDALAKFRASIKDMAGQLQPQKLVIMYVSAKLHHVDVFDDASDVEIEVRWSGMTHLDAAFTQIGDYSENPEAVICFTDLCVSSNDLQHPPACQTLFVSTNKDTAPFGKVRMI